VIETARRRHKQRHRRRSKNRIDEMSRKIGDALGIKSEEVF